MTKTLLTIALLASTAACSAHKTTKAHIVFPPSCMPSIAVDKAQCVDGSKPDTWECKGTFTVHAICYAPASAEPR